MTAAWECDIFETQGLTLVTASIPRPDEPESSDRFNVAASKGSEHVWVALSDGCSESLWAGSWARCLSRIAGWTADEVPAHSPQEALGAFLHRAREDHRPIALTDRERAKLHEGDFATLLLCALSRDDERVVVRGVALGDTLAIAITPDGAHRAFPASRSEELNASPMLLWSRAGREAVEAAATMSFVWDDLPPGTRVLLCTDEIARWVLQACELGARDALVRALDDIAIGASPLSCLVRALPISGDDVPSHTDDLTLTLCDVLPPHRGRSR